MEDESLEEDGIATWTCTYCTFRNIDALQTCAMCQSSRSTRLFSNGFQMPQFSGRISTFLGNLLSGAVTGTFALVGGLSGAITGAIAGRAARHGLLRGAGLGAVAGAVLSIEMLEASRAYWRSEHSDSNLLPSIYDFLDDLISGRIMQEFIMPAVSASQRWQLNLGEMSYEELYEMFIPTEPRIKGASEEFLHKLPCHIVTQENRLDAGGEAICCPICLQELEKDEIARTLPSCGHTFHMSCVDTWLMKQIICPVCRHYL